MPSAEALLSTAESLAEKASVSMSQGRKILIALGLARPGVPSDPGEDRRIERAQVRLDPRPLGRVDVPVLDQLQELRRLLGHGRLGIAGKRLQGGEDLLGGERSAAERGGEVARQGQPLGGAERGVTLLQEYLELRAGKRPPVVAPAAGVEGEPRGTGLAGQRELRLLGPEQHTVGALAGLRGPHADRHFPSSPRLRGRTERKLPRLSQSHSRRPALTPQLGVEQRKPGLLDEAAQGRPHVRPLRRERTHQVVAGRVPVTVLGEVLADSRPESLGPEELLEHGDDRAALPVHDAVVESEDVSLGLQHRSESDGPWRAPR